MEIGGITVKSFVLGRIEVFDLSLDPTPRLGRGKGCSYRFQESTKASKKQDLIFAFKVFFINYSLLTNYYSIILCLQSIN